MCEASVVVKVEDINAVKKKLFFDVPWVDVKKELDACYRDMGIKAKIKGFRPGKVPRKILESRFKDHVEEEAINNLINKYYWDALKGRGIIAVSQPDIHQNGIEQDNKFSFDATVEVEPVIEPKDYIGLELEKEEKEVTENDIEARLQQIRQMFGTLEDMTDEREVKLGDFAMIDFAGTLDGEQIKEMTSDNYLIEIGAGTFVPGFEEHVVGMSKGQTKNVQVRFPDEYRMPRIAGKEISFSITLKGVKEKKLPELDDNFIRNFNKFETLEDLKDEVRRNLEEENKTESEMALHNLIVTKLLEANHFEAPPSFIERQISYMIADVKREMVSRGMNRKEIEEISVNYREIYKDEATKIVKTFLLLKNIALKESMTVDDDVINSRIREMAQRRGQDFDSLKKSLEDDNILEGIVAEILNEKVIEFIKEKANIHQPSK